MVIALLSVILVVCWLSCCAGYCEGEWKDFDSPDMSTYMTVAARNQLDTSDFDASSRIFINNACPAQVVQHTCYYFGDPAHARKLEYRRWILKDNPNDRCVPFRPTEFLSLVRDRRVLFLGDSVMGELFVSLLCALYHTTESFYRFRFMMLLHGDNFLRPLNQSKHSYNQGGTITFHALKVTMAHILVNHPNENIAGILKSHRVTTQDIIVLNPGLHFNDRGEYRNALGSLQTLLQSLKQSSPGNFPIIFYLQITPQHFPDMPNGYYGQRPKNFKGTRICKLF